MTYHQDGCTTTSNTGEEIPGSYTNSPELTEWRFKIIGGKNITLEPKGDVGVLTVPVVTLVVPMSATGRPSLSIIQPCGIHGQIEDSG